MLRDALTHPKGRVRVALDEGGLRCSWSWGAGYVPFGLLADAALRESLFGNTQLVLTANGGETLRIRLENANALSVQSAILARLAELRASPREPLPAGLARERRPLDRWLHDVGVAASGMRGYRETAVDGAMLAAVLTSDHADPEARAAAAYALVGRGDADALLLVARTLVHQALPPLVLVAARLAPGGHALVSDDLLEDLRGFLLGDDRARLQAMVGVRDPAREALASQALLQATAEALAEISPPGHGKAKHRQLHIASGADGGMRWVGRTYAY